MAVKTIDTFAGECTSCGNAGDMNYADENGPICNGCAEPYIRERVRQICEASTSKNPREILDTLIADDLIAARPLRFHIIVGSALASAYRNSGGKIDLNTALDEIMRRGAFIPPKACGHAGDCGSAVSAGIFFSVIADTHPLKEENWGELHMLTGSCLYDLGKIGGPRCCNRGANVSMGNAVKTVKRIFGIEMEWHEVQCTHQDANDKCIGGRCPFSPEC